jgi:hypothetical protein
MTIRTTAPIGLNDVLLELRVTNPGRGLPISLGDPDVRALAGKTSGPISLSDFYGKSSYISMSGSLPDVFDTSPSNPTVSYQKSVGVSVQRNGGLAPFTYQWSTLSGSSSINQANSPSTEVIFTVARFSQAGDGYSQTVQCVITDATGARITLQGTVYLELS